MKELTVMLTSIVALIGSIFLFAILGALFGAISGWLVSFVFDDAIKKVIGRQDLELWQVGAAVGWVSGFFRNVKGSK